MKLRIIAGQQSVSSFVSDLSDAAINMIIERLDVVPSPMSKLFVKSFHGAVTRIPIQRIPTGARGTTC